jgi:hypothetical protein
MPFYILVQANGSILFSSDPVYAKATPAAAKIRMESANVPNIKIATITGSVGAYSATVVTSNATFGNKHSDNF